MPTEKFNFANIFRQNLTKSAIALTKKFTSRIEKDMLSEHALLVKATNLPIDGFAKNLNSLAIVVGTAQGMDNIHEAFFLGERLKRKKKKLRVVYITSAKIGVSLNVINRLKVPGVNAKVLGRMLSQYGVAKDDIIIESQSRNADEQGFELLWLAKKHKFKNMALVMDTWHGPRFYMSLVKHNSETNFFSHYVDRDVDNINSAAYDYPQSIFQTPLLIAEVARIHTYAERGTGGVGVEELINYITQKQKLGLLPKSISSSETKKLLNLWHKNHTFVVKNFDKLASYR